jgi:hypothetical protein
VAAPLPDLRLFALLRAALAAELLELLWMGAATELLVLLWTAELVEPLWTVLVTEPLEEYLVERKAHPGQTKVVGLEKAALQTVKVLETLEHCNQAQKVFLEELVLGLPAKPDQKQLHIQAQTRMGWVAWKQHWLHVKLNQSLLLICSTPETRLCLLPGLCQWHVH